MYASARVAESTVSLLFVALCVPGT
jgi:hypothetical protein